MKEFKNYRVFKKEEKIIVSETLKRTSVNSRPTSKQEVLNDMILEYPIMLKKLKDLQK